MRETIFIGDWTDLQQMAKDFAIGDNWVSTDVEQSRINAFLVSIKYYTILLAYYTYKDYEGDAFVLLEKEGKLYEVNGSHCSCHGLENQWLPEETSIESLTHRLDEGTLGKRWDWGKYEDEYATQLRELLKEYQ